MVKNVKGGTGHKSQARKFVVSKPSSKLRIAEEDGEIYAVISKIYGNGMCEALCIDDVSRLCIIRGKFRGRGKRDNTIRPGSWILAGKREWEADKVGEKQKCDLLEVYTDYDIEKLKKSVHENWTIFNNIVTDKGSVPKIDGLEFSNSSAMEHERILLGLGEESKDKITLDMEAPEDDDDDNDEICIDDI